jgi:hypothetical protein
VSACRSDTTLDGAASTAGSGVVQSDEQKRH